MAIIQKSKNMFCVFIKGLYFFHFNFPEGKDVLSNYLSLCHMISMGKTLFSRLNDL